MYKSIPPSFHIANVSTLSNHPKQNKELNFELNHLICCCTLKIAVVRWFRIGIIEYRSHFEGGLQHLVHHSAQRIGASRSPGSLTRIKFYFLKRINNRLFIRTVHIDCKQFILLCFNTRSLK